MKELSLILIFVMFISSNLVFAQSEEAEVEMEPDEPCGLNVKMKDGKFSSIKACGEKNVRGKVNKRKIRAAKKVAIMRAKAKIAKFMNEEIASEDTYNKIKNSLSTELEEEETFSMEEVETQTESIKNSAKALLKGVKVIEEIPYEDYIEVWVGINLKTMKAADSLKYNIEKDHAEGERAADKKKVSSGSSTSSSKSKKKSNRRKSADADEF